MFIVLCSMIVGVIIGFNWFPSKFHKINSRIQVVCTAVLIFSMGVMLGKRPNFLQELSSLGFSSLIFSIVPIIASVIVVYILTYKFMKHKDSIHDTHSDC